MLYINPVSHILKIIGKNISINNESIEYINIKTNGKITAELTIG
tara:strand:- start:1663 stop:1794 length:132 start_codon:yes stop_codon:yes gene_type:complete